MNDPFPHDSEPRRPVSQFVTTHWSAVLAAGQKESNEVTDALEKLCRIYWNPLYAYIRRQGSTPADAEDLTQAFFARLLQKGVIDKADPQRGRFRSFLLASLRHFLADERDRALAQKRGGGRELLSFAAPEAEAAYIGEPVDTMSPDKVYDRRWAATLMQEAMQRLRTDQVAAGTLAQFDVLSTLLLDDTRSNNYAAVGQQLGLSANAVAAAVYRLRKRYRHFVRAEIAQTVAEPSQVDVELRHLLSAITD